MKAIIFNSGLGNRMGDLTRHQHKSMTRLLNGETIFHRQLRLLSEAGIRDFIITTGPFEEQLKQEAADFPQLNFTFVRNPIYDRTNYIYSMYLAREHMDDDLVFLHGDLVFDRRLVRDVLACPQPNTATVNFAKALPEKDFKGRVRDGRLQESPSTFLTKTAMPSSPSTSWKSLLCRPGWARWSGSSPGVRISAMPKMR